MIIVAEGLAGSGKTMLIANLVKKEWENGVCIFPNFPLWYDDEVTRIKRWHNLDETYHINDGIIFIDESQKLLDARKWQSLPATFTDKIAMHRHHRVDIYTTTQDLSHIDKRLRTNVHELYRCDVLFRYPKNQRVKPIIQVTRMTKRERSYNKETNKTSWKKTKYNKLLFISKFFTKTYYDTYGDVGQKNFLCKLQFQKKPNEKKGQWKAKIYSREMVDRGKARL